MCPDIANFYAGGGLTVGTTLLIGELIICVLIAGSCQFIRCLFSTRIETCTECNFSCIITTAKQSMSIYGMLLS